MAYRFYQKLGCKEVEWAVTRPMACKVGAPALRGKSTELEPAVSIDRLYGDAFYISYLDEP